MRSDRVVGKLTKIELPIQYACGMTLHVSHELDPNVEVVISGVGRDHPVLQSLEKNLQMEGVVLHIELDDPEDT